MGNLFSERDSVKKRRNSTQKKPRTAGPNIEYASVSHLTDAKLWLYCLSGVSAAVPVRMFTSALVAPSASSACAWGSGSDRLVYVVPIKVMPVLDVLVLDEDALALRGREPSVLTSLPMGSFVRMLSNDSTSETNCGLRVYFTTKSPQNGQFSLV